MQKLKIGYANCFEELGTFWSGRMGMAEDAKWRDGCLTAIDFLSFLWKIGYVIWHSEWIESGFCVVYEI